MSDSFKNRLLRFEVNNLRLSEYITGYKYSTGEIVSLGNDLFKSLSNNNDTKPGSSVYWKKLH